MLVGRTISHYEIGERLGSGAMGEVYAARDTRLEREIAIKILPGDLATDPDRVARFDREAKAVAALNHPNIVTIHSVEEVDGTRFLTMERIAGRSLDRLIPRAGLPLDRFFGLAVPLADALSAAHKAGVVHRDLKPSNIMVNAEGRVKVLDFGLAKLRRPAGPEDKTRLATATITQEGQLLGTLPYMSPEQVQGRPADARSDAFALGAIFYEMLTGRRPFAGETSADLISAILREEPRSASDVRPETPRHLGRIVKRCLAKDPERRFQSALDIRNELEELRDEVASGQSVPVAGVRPQPWTVGWRGIVAGLAAVAAVTAAGLTYLQSRRDVALSEAPPRVTLTQLTSQAGVEHFPSLSPNGEFVVYAARDDGDWDIQLLRVGGSNPINLTADSPADDTEPAFSPDGQRIVFRSERDEGGLFVMGSTGESVRRIAGRGHNPAWSPDGEEIAFSTQRTEDPRITAHLAEVWIVALESGDERRLQVDAKQPAWSPTGDRIAYWSTGSNARNIWTIPARGGEPTAITTHESWDWNPIWSPDGRQLYFASNRGGQMNIWRLPVDENSGASRGEPQPVTTGAGAEVGLLSLSGDGRSLAYAASTERRNLQWLEFDARAGRVLGEPQWITRGTQLAHYCDPSPDGEWIAFTLGDPGDLAVARRNGTGLRKLTEGSHRDLYPRWSPDGERIAFSSKRSGSREIWVIDADGSNLTQITDDPDQELNAPSWAPDGSRIAMSSHSTLSTYTLELDQPWSDSALRELPPLSEGERFLGVDWSPDGRSLAGGLGPGIAIFDFDAGTYRRVSGQGWTAHWLADGRRLIVGEWERIFLLDTLTGESRDLFSPLPDRILLSARPSADDSMLVFTRVTKEADIWLMTFDEP